MTRSLMVFTVDHNPRWGTRLQHEDRERFGPFSTYKKAAKKANELIAEHGYSPEAPQVEIIPQQVL